MTRLCICAEIPGFMRLLGKLDSSTWDEFSRIAKESTSIAGDVGTCLEKEHEHGREPRKSWSSSMTSSSSSTRRSEKSKFWSGSVSASMSVSGSRSLRGWCFHKFGSSRHRVLAHACLDPPSPGFCLPPRRGRKGLEMIGRTPGSPWCMYIHTNETVQQTHPIAAHAHTVPALCLDYQTT